MPVFGSLASGNTACVYLEIESPSAQQVTLGLGADWWMQAWLNGQEIVNTTRQGNAHWPPAREHEVVALQLAFAEGEREGDFESVAGGGLRGPAYLVPKDPEVNRVSWHVQIPRGGDYFLWLRYVSRGSGQRANQPVRHAVRALLNGKPLIDLGGLLDLNVADKLVAVDQVGADRFWTWTVPGEWNLQPARLPAGDHVLTLEKMRGDTRYDVLLITDEPSFRPADGRLRQQP